MSNDKGASNEQIVLKIKSKEDVIENMLFLWQQNQGFVHKMAVRYSGFAEVEDLKQEAYIGLCAAVEHYDEEKGVPFVNYAGFWIKQIMQRYIDNCGSTVRIPVGQGRKFRSTEEFPTSTVNAMAEKRQRTKCELF